MSEHLERRIWLLRPGTPITEAIRRQAAGAGTSEFVHGIPRGLRHLVEGEIPPAGRLVVELVEKVPELSQEERLAAARAELARLTTELEQLKGGPS